MLVPVDPPRNTMSPATRRILRFRRASDSAGIATWMRRMSHRAAGCENCDFAAAAAAAADDDDDEPHFAATGRRVSTTRAGFAGVV
jgi:hypothetical protein